MGTDYRRIRMTGTLSMEFALEQPARLGVSHATLGSAALALARSDA